MPNYPKTIKSGTFAGIVDPVAPRPSRVLSVQRLTDKSSLENATDLPVVKVTSLEIGVDATGKKTTDPGLTVADAPADYDGSSARRICFVPLQEVVKITWKFDNYALVTGARVEIYRDNAGTAELIWTKQIGWSGGACPATCETTFGGDLDAVPAGGSEGDSGAGGVSGANRVVVVRSGTAAFPDNTLTAEFAPYLVRVVVSATASAAQWNPASRWVFLDVLAKVKTLYWGDPKMVPADRDDLTIDDTRKAGARVDELKILKAQRTATDGSTPKNSLGTGDYEIALPMPVFKIVVNKTEEADHTDYEQAAKYWGDGPRFPITAEIVMLKSDGSQVSEPKALGNMKFLWDWEDVDDPTANPKWQTWLDGGSDDHCKNFAKGVIKTNKDPLDPLDSDNCPVALGGKRGAGAKPMFPPAAGYDPAGALRDGAFPFAVASDGLRTRRWAALSSVWRSGLLTSYTGAVFQPSRMAGDKYKITVFPFFDSAYLDSATKSKDLRTGAGADGCCASGYFEVFRQFDVACVKRGTIADLNWTAIKAVYKTELGIILNVTNSALDERLFKLLLTNAMDTYRRERNHLSAYNYAPLMLDFGIDLNPPANSPAIVIPDLAQFQTNLDTAFQNNKVFKIKLDAEVAREFHSSEDVMDNDNGRGIVVKKEGEFLFILAQKDRDFAAKKQLRGRATHNEGAVLEIFGSCWESEVVTANHPTGRKVKVTTAAGEHVISYLPFEKTMSQKTKNALAALVGKCAMERPATEKLTITVSARQADADDLDRRNRVEAYIRSLLHPATGIVVDRRGLAASIKSSEKLKRFYQPNQKDFVLGLLEPALREYVEDEHENVRGVVFFHLPGRDAQFKVKATGGFFPESSKRDRGMAFTGTWNGGGYLTQRANGTTINYKTNDSIAAHELGHALFIPHALEKKDSRPPDPLKPQQHIVGSTCIMNYDSDSDHFCSFCMYRMRGWDWNPLNVVRFAVNKVRITDAGDARRSKWYSFAVTDYGRDDAGADTFHFAPHAETAKIRYTIEDPQTRIKSGKLTLKRVRDGQVLWSRALTGPEYAVGDNAIDWDGLTNGATAYFPDNYITPEHSPYQLEVSVEGEAFADPPLGWTQFEVQFAPLEYSWGPKTVLAVSPAQGTTAAQLATATGLERDHQVWEYLNNNEVPAPYAYLGATGAANLTNQVPKPDETKKVFMVSNQFYTDTAEQTQNSAYTQMRAAWGDGPNIPLFLTLKLKKSDDSAVSEPLAVGPVKVLWDWEDATVATDGPVVPDEQQELADVENDFMDVALNFEPASVPTGICCHAERGGKRGLPGCTFFPAQADPGTTTPGPQVFPFEVSHTVATNRTWAAVSSYQKAGTFAGQSGVMFQPPAVAGDAYIVRAYLYYAHELATVNVADVDGDNSPKEQLDPSRQAATGRLEMWREIHVAAYYKKNAGMIGGAGIKKDIDFAVIQTFFTKAFTRVRASAPQGMTQVAFDAAVNQVVTDSLSVAPPPSALPAVIGHAIDPAGNWAHGDHLLHFRAHAAYKTELETEAITAHGGLGALPPNYWRDLLLPAVKDPYWTTHSVWSEACYTTEGTYKYESAANWARQAGVRVLDAYVTAISANPPDGIYVLQADNACQLGDGPVAFAGAFQPTKRNRIVFMYVRVNLNSVVEESASHEFGHCLFLNHCNDKNGDWFCYHTNVKCLMSYNYPGRFLCSTCLMRIRGWSLYKVNPGGGTLESAVAARDPDTGRTLCPKAVDTPRTSADGPKTVARKVYR